MSEEVWSAEDEFVGRCINMYNPASESDREAGTHQFCFEKCSKKQRQRCAAEARVKIEDKYNPPAGCAELAVLLGEEC